MAELKRYDMKVYQASIEMVTAMTMELKNLGVPFFGIRVDLLGSQRAEETSPNYDARNDIVQKGSTGRLGGDDLRKLQRRMLELLEDLCKD